MPAGARGAVVRGGGVRLPGPGHGWVRRLGGRPGARHDRLSLDGNPLGGGYRDNLAASKAAGTPVEWDTFGTDTRIVVAPVTSGARRPVLSSSTGRDAWQLGPVVVVTYPRPV
jgi:hypothetical protein